MPLVNAVLKNPVGAQQISGFGLTLVSLTVNGNLHVVGTMTKENLVTVAFSATPQFDASLGRSFELTLTGNVTSSTIINTTGGKMYVFILIQDATGNRAFVWPANVKNASAINPAPNSISVQAFKARANGNLYPIGPMTYS